MRANQHTYSRMRTEIGQAPHRVFPLIQLILAELGLSWEERMDTTRGLFNILGTEADEQRAAVAVWNLLGAKENVVAEKLAGRASQIYGQIVPHLASESVLDFGAGDARVAALVAESGKRVELYDVADYRTTAARAANLPFTSNWADIRGQEYQTGLAVTVFHHCLDPDAEILRLREVAERIIVIESVISRPMPWALQALVDWLYNRGMHPGAAIPVPGQFRTVAEWRAAFARFNLRSVYEQDLGLDLPVVPEHHYLFVLER